jgi:hypothetical protein
LHKETGIGPDPSHEPEAHVDLTDLKARVDRAVAERDAPPAPGGSKPIVPADQLLGEDGWKETWSVVRALRRSHGEVFNLFPEMTLALQVLDVLAESSKVPTLGELADQLRRLAAQDGPWLVSTPLTGIEMALDEPAINIDNHTVLWRAHLGDQSWQGVPQASRDADEASSLAVFKMLDDHLDRPSQWLTLTGRGDEIDTGRTATLLTVEDEAIGLALPRAQAKAQYAIAVWVLLSPPGPDRIVPDLGVWVPQPQIHIRQRYKRLEQGKWPAKERTQGGGIWMNRGYQVPDLATLRTPFQAVAVKDRRCAQALLSASLTLHTASRGSRYQLSERLRAVRSAIETLCESAPGKSDAEERWERLVARYGVENVLAERGYEQGDAEAISRRLRIARNVATHGADAVLLDLGWPAGLDRPGPGKAVTKAEDLGIAALHADLAMLGLAVRLVLREMWPVVRECGFDEAAFEALF